MHRLLLIDDEHLVRTGLKTTIDWSSLDIKIIGEAENGQVGLELIKSLCPDIVILDIKMPIMSGFELVQQLDMDEFDGKIIILSGSSDFEFVKELLEKGVFSYLLKPIKNDEIIKKVRDAVKALEIKRKQKQQIEYFKQHHHTLSKVFMLNLLFGKVHKEAELNRSMQVNDLHIPSTGTLIYGVLGQEPDMKQVDFLNRVSMQSNFSCFTMIDESRFVMFYSHNFNEAFEQANVFLKTFQEMFDSTLSLAVSSPYQKLISIHFQFEEVQRILNQQLFINISGVYSTTQSKSFKPQIMQALKYVANHYHENISVSIVSQAIFVSESYLMHTFKSDTGYTFNEYVTMYRMNQAKVLLEQGKYKIYEIAQKVGYNDVKYFSQVFRKITGYTPTKYMSEHQYD
jgi:two-component system response regulator YesN